MDWDDYCMNFAIIASHKSEDPKHKVGACIVNEENKTIVGVGYNQGMYLHYKVRPI